jgi:hypothetical protein
MAALTYSLFNYMCNPIILTPLLYPPSLPNTPFAECIWMCRYRLQTNWEFKKKIDQWLLWRVLSPGVKWDVICWNSADVSEENVASNFRFQESCNMKQVACRASSPETQVHFRRTTRRYVPEDSTLHYFQYLQHHKNEFMPSYNNYIKWNLYLYSHSL